MEPKASIKEKTQFQWSAVFHIGIMIVAVFGCLLFLFGFLSVKSTSTQASSENKSSVRTKPLISRMVFMVIDALRSDFIGGIHGKANMPYVSKLLQQGEACLFTAKANPPTVTMPRIKAMVTGTVPGFVDIILNLGSPKLTDDSFVSNLAASGDSVIFYGDDTWLRLFPNTFLRSEGTTSFFVSDYTEVDLNVTRHLSRELANRDWKLMILHYLGLDHIGHLVGPHSPLVEPKLKEMDAIIQEIHLGDPKDELPQLLLVCGDHGMKDSGSHGGASVEETHVAVLVIGSPCHSSEEEINQIDLAPTLSVILGLPEPSASVGILFLNLLVSMKPRQRLEVLNKNSKHLAEQLGHHLSSKQDSLLQEAHKLYKVWNENESEDLTRRIEMLYSSAASDMSSSLLEAHSNFDVFLMIIGAVIAFESMLVLSLPVLCKSRLTSNNYFLPFFVVVFYVGINSLQCSFVYDTSLMCSFQPKSILLHIIISSIVTYNTVMLYIHFSSIRFQLPKTIMERFLIIGTLLHSVALGSSSFVEEEHQVWYFLWTSLLILSLTTKNWHLTLINLVIQRIARKWNQTGDKWASLPDVQDYVAGNKMLTAVLLLGGLTTIGCYLIKIRNNNCLSKCIYAVMFILIYFYQAAVGSVDLPHLKHFLSHQGWVEARVFGICLVILIVNGILNSSKSSLDIGCICRDSWILLIALLRRPHDVILIPAQLFASYTLGKVYHGNIDMLVVSHYWLGWVAYFHQGNSNSLASVDLVAGYVGLVEYQPTLVGTFLLSHTYAAPVLSQLLLSCTMLAQFRKPEIARGLHLTSILRLLPMCMYLLVVVTQREHLFIWSVFAPKLLYEVTATSVFLLILFPCYLPSMFKDKI